MFGEPISLSLLLLDTAAARTKRSQESHGLVPAIPGPGTGRLPSWARVRERVALIQRHLPDLLFVWFQSWLLQGLSCGRLSLALAQYRSFPDRPARGRTSDGKALWKMPAPVQNNPNASPTHTVLSLHRRESRSRHAQPTQGPERANPSSAPHQRLFCAEMPVPPVSQSPLTAALQDDSSGGRQRTKNCCYLLALQAPLLGGVLL